MEPILFLVHRIPFPPNKGDKIRSHHLLRHLAVRYRVHLGSFIDSRDEAEHVHALDDLCASHCVVTLDHHWATVRSVSGFFTGEPLTLSYYRSDKLSRWVKKTVVEYKIRKAVVFSGAMAQYVEPWASLRVVLDLVDVDSAKWMQYAERRAWPLSFVYRREGIKLLAFERGAAARAAATVFVTQAETDLFIALAPESASRVHAIGMGVDTAYFVPSVDRPSPYSANEAAIVFTGVMDYWPNIDAVSWFAREVLPRVVQQRPDARFYVVGMNPTKFVRALATDPRVMVTGWVADVRPYLQHASVVVAPLRVARGIQSKILEAMAMAKPVVASTAAARGVTAVPGSDFETAGDSEEFSRKVLQVMRPEVSRAIGQRARARVVAGYCWEHNLSAFEELVEPDCCKRADVAVESLDAR